MNTDPIDIRFVINSPEVQQDAQKVIDTVHGVTQDTTTQASQMAKVYQTVFSQVSEALTQAFGADKIQALDTALKTTTSDAEALTTITKFLRDNLADLKVNPDVSKDLTTQLNEMLAALDKAELAPATVAEQGMTNISRQLYQIKQQLATLSPGDAGYKELQGQAAQLQQRISDTNKEIKLMGSNTPGLDALKTSARGLVSAFTGAATSVALLSDNNDVLQSTIVKMIAAMQVVNSLQEVGALLSEKSAVSVYLQAQYNNLFAASAEKAAIATEAQGAAMVTEAAATEGATVATVAFNAALDAAGIGLVIAAVEALAVGIGFLIEKTKSETEIQQELNDALIKTNQLMAELVESSARVYEENTTAAKNAVSYAEAAGRSQKEINSLKAKAIEAERQEAIYKLSALGYDEQKIKTAQARLDLYNQEIRALSGLPESSLTEEQKKQLELLESQKKALEALYNPAFKYYTAIKQTTQQQSELQAQDDLQTQQRAAKSATAYAEARAIAAQKGSEEELKARISAINAERNAELQNINLTAGERVKINADADKQIADARRQYANQQLADQQSLAQAAIDMAKKGSITEFNARIALVQLQAQQELNQEGITSAKRVQIEADAAKQIADIRKQYNFEAAETDANIAKTETETRLSQAEKGTEQELQLRKQLIDQQADLDVISAQKQIDNEQLLSARINGIHAKALVDKKRLNDQYRDKELQEQLHNIDKQTASSSAQYQSTLNNPFSTAVQRDLAAYKITQLEIAANNEKIALTEKHIAEAAGDINKAKQELDDLKQKGAALEGTLNNLIKQETRDRLGEISSDLSDISTAFSALSSSIADTNAGLSDTIGVMGKLSNASGDVLKGLASGNPVGIVSGIISGVAGLFSIGAESRASRRQAAAEMQQYQQQLVQGEVQYNELIRERARNQQDITDLTVQELKARQQMLDVQKQDAQQDYNAKLAQIQLQGLQVTREHTEKYGGFIGIGRKTKVVQDTASVAGLGYDQLEELFTEGKLDDATAAWFQQLQKVHDELGDIGDAAQDTADAINQALTGTTASSIADSIAQGFQQGKLSAADFADDFKGIMQQALLASFEDNALKDQVAEFYKEFAADAASGGSLDKGEVAALQNAYNGIINNAAEQFQELQDISGISFNNNTQQQGSAAAIKSITEDTANELAGITRGQYDEIKRQGATLLQQLAVQQKIQANTANTVTRLDAAVSYLKTISTNTKPAQNSRDLGHG